MTQGPGRGAGPSPGRGRGPQGRGSRGSAGRDGKSGPGAARASGRTDGTGGRGGPRRPARGATPPPRSSEPAKPSGKSGPKKPGGAKGAAKPASARSASAKTAAPKSSPAKTTSGKAAAPKGGSAKKGTGTAAGKRTPVASPQGRAPARPRKGADKGPGRTRRPRRGGGSGPPRGPRHRGVFDRRDPLKRLNIGLLAVAFVLSLFAGRLVQLQTIDDDRYAELALRQRVKEIELPALRGEITDAKGNPFAMTVEARSVFVDPSIIEPGKRQEIVNALAPTLGLNPATVMKAVSKPDTQFVYLAHGVRPEKARMINDWGFAGIGTLPEYRREYPNGSLAAGVIGFVNDSGKGAAGIEAAMNDVLAGRDGRQRVELSLEGQHIPMGEDQKQAPVPGRSIRLTLLQDLQYKAQEAITRQVKATGSEGGSVIVMDPRSGKILAMASAPGYDPNRYGASKPDVWGSPLVQRAFEPGSTGKVATAAAVLEHGGVTPQTPFTVPDRIRRYELFRDSHPHPTERLTFAGVLAESSNVGTILAAERISEKQLYDTLREFGFGEKTGLNLPGETAGSLRPPDRWSGTDRHTIAFGQGLSVNAVQMASVYATIANGGVRVEPSLIAGTVDEDDEFDPADGPETRRVVSARTARQISDMLEGVTTEEGTAPKAQIEGYRVAGKTGTAERINPDTGAYRGGGYVASFAGFAPADDPRLVVQVVLENPRRGSHYGGDVAAPVFRDVMGFALQTQKIPPTGSEPPTIRTHARD
ncbi:MULTISPECIES: peptidoglycan D,D-transpeptidase FtsI family protein [Actinomadura]|uniref:peptidoglycan D,D-transpeptidase FtsI family protein n=1 Tax=Actinomadura TaxID=1988 RepID=UPI000408E73F|nr:MULTISPECIES: penicillin-binding protein 2 [Actinomadura]RSN51161.1 peptidoglycan glycosyltransferase [Actinomadura sp. WAC 06369]